MLRSLNVTRSFSNGIRRTVCYNNIQITRRSYVDQESLPFLKPVKPTIVVHSKLLNPTLNRNERLSFMSVESEKDIRKLLRNNIFSQAIKQFNNMTNHNYHPTSAFLAEFLGYIAKYDLSVAKKIFESRPKSTLEAYHLNAILQGYFSKGDAEGALLYLKIVEKDLGYLELPKSTLFIILEGLNNTASIIVLEKFVKDIIANHDSEYYKRCAVHEAIKANLERKSLPKALEWLQSAKKFGDVTLAYSMVITYYAKDGQYDKAFEIIDEMKNENIPRTIEIYNSILMSYSMSNRLDDAERVLNLIKEENIEISFVTIETILHINVKKRDTQKVFETVELAEQLNLKPRPNFYHILAGYFVSGGDRDNFLNVMDKYNSKMVFETHFFTTIFKGFLASKKNIDLLEEYKKKFTEAGYEKKRRINVPGDLLFKTDELIKWHRGSKDKKNINK